MKLIKHERFTRGLFFRIYLYFAIMLSFFAVLIGLIFMKIYETYSVDSYSHQLQTQAELISERISEFVVYEDYSDYPIYIDMIDQLELYDVWVVTNPNAVNPMNKELENIDLMDIDQNSDIETLLKEVLLGKKKSISKFSQIYQVVVMTSGAPIYNSQNEVAGAVLINSQLETQDKIINSSKFIIIVSIVLALFISYIIAILFARKLSRPISKIRLAAVELVKENYDVRTNINQKDEIGDLGQTINILANRLQQSELERENMEKMKLDFFANVSHELRTPITVLRAYLESLVDKVVVDETKINQSYLRMLLECKGMERLVGDLLLLSKMENPEFEIEKEPINVIQVFDDIIRNAHAISIDKDIHFDITRDKEACFMLGDYDRLRQMFMVVIDNAIKFSENGSTLFITVSCKEKIEVSIRDEGVGMDEEEIPYIFDKFYRSKLHNNKNGSGLGLLIAKQIAKKHDGSIEVTSKKGEGSCFLFSFDQINI